MEDRGSDNEIDLVAIAGSVYRNWKFMAMVVLVSVLTTGFISMTQKKMYGSWVIFFPVPMREYVSEDSVSEIKSRQLTTESLVLSILKSRTMGEKIILDLGLQGKWLIKDLETCRLKLLSRIKVEVSGGILKLIVRDHSGQLAADIANAYVDSLGYFNKKMELGVNRALVKVIDRGVVSKQRLSRGTVVKVSLAMIISFVLSFVLVYVKESISKNNYLARIKQS